MNIVAFAGGVGGAKLVDGLAHCLPPENLTIIVNTGDDFEHWGLNISPDLDTVCYTLAGLANPETGWGRAGESLKLLNGSTVTVAASARAVPGARSTVQVRVTQYGGLTSSIEIVSPVY